MSEEHPDTAYLDAVRQWLADFDPGGDPRAITSVRRILELLDGAEPPMRRTSFAPGHLTGSAILLAPDERRFALIWHKKLQRWLQPGGHVEEGDAGPLGTARREAVEECGVPLDPDFAPILIQVDVHRIPPHREEPAHDHHDLVFLLRAAEDALRPSTEAERAVWCPLDATAPYALDGALAASVARTRAWLAAQRGSKPQS